MHLVVQADCARNNAICQKTLVLETLISCEPDHKPQDDSQGSKLLTEAEERASAVYGMQRIHHSLTISMSAEPRCRSRAHLCRHCRTFAVGPLRQRFALAGATDAIPVLKLLSEDTTDDLGRTARSDL